MGQSSSTTYGSSKNYPHDKDLEAREIGGDKNPDPHRVERSELVDGDHIYRWSSSTAYAHHGIYVGNDLVVHFVNPTGGSGASASRVVSGMSKYASSCPSSASSNGSVLSNRYLKNNVSSRGKNQLTCLNFYDCGLRKPGTGVIYSCLNCFLNKTRSLCRYEYGVSRSTYEMEIRGGTCTTAESSLPKEVINRAKYLFEEGFGKYDLERHNCEDFALYCKTGLLTPNKKSAPTSSQVNFVINLVSQKEKTHRGNIPMYGSKMYFRDIGVRTDVVKVAPENVAAFLDRRDRQKLAPA